jgi:hypothetical protein
LATKAFNPASTEPAPKPRGIAASSIQKKEGISEKPTRAMAVRVTLKTMTFPVPRRLSIRPENKLEMIVPIETTRDAMPA